MIDRVNYRRLKATAFIRISGVETPAFRPDLTSL